MPFKGKGITLKLWLVMITLVLLVLGSFSLALNYLFADFYTNQKLDSLKQEVQREAASLGSSQDLGELQAQLNNIRYTEGMSALVLNNQGQIEALGGAMHGIGRGMGMMNVIPLSQTDFNQVLAGETIAKTLTMTDGYGVATAVTQLKLPGGIKWVLMLNSPLAPVTESIRSFSHLLYYVAGGAIVLATLFALWLSRTVTTPLIEMNQIARKMSAGDFSDRLTVSTKDEIGDLRNSFNILAAELDKNIKLLSQEKEQLGGILESMGDAVLTLNEHGDLVQVNPPALELWQDDAGRQEKVLACLREALAEVNKTGVSAMREVEIDTQVLNIHMEPLRNIAGYGGGVAVIRDVTAGHRQEKLRRELMASVSHELRTPIHLVQGQLEALADGLVPVPEQKNYVEMSLQEIQRLGRLVGDLQEINRLEQGFPIVQNRLDLGQLACEVGEKYQTRAEAQGLELKVESGTTLVFGDKDRLTQVIVNLLENSLWYTPEGGKIIIKVQPEAEMGVLSVSDTGKGIAMDHLPYVWESFFRGDKSGKTHMGLGLTIVKRIVEAHGGNVSASSELGKGTTFWIRLPLIA